MNEDDILAAFRRDVRMFWDGGKRARLPLEEMELALRVAYRESGERDDHHWLYQVAGMMAGAELAADAVGAGDQDRAARMREAGRCLGMLVIEIQRAS